MWGKHGCPLRHCSGRLGVLLGSSWSSGAICLGRLGAVWGRPRILLGPLGYPRNSSRSAAYALRFAMGGPQAPFGCAGGSLGDRSGDLGAPSALA
eukprot:3867738-Pyramimonas_sp.AAC.1